MSNLTAVSPLMQPVQYQGQPYFTSQYFHQQYLTNSHAGGKYQRHTHFLRLLRSIEAYQDYLERGDIVELTWQGVLTEGNQNRVSFQPLFQAAGWNPVTLLNATAQIAMSHHLDDELSKQMSVATNVTVARQATRDMLPEELATRKVAAWLEAGKLFGTPPHIVQQEAAKKVLAETGVDFRPLLLAAPAQNTLADDERMLEPTDLAPVLGMKSGYAVNMFLQGNGWQHKPNGHWEPTAKGQPYAALHAWSKQGKEGYNYRWRVTAVQHLMQQRNGP